MTVTFTAPGSGASGTFAGGVNTATTNASGIATSATFTANSTVGGPYSVTASVSGVGTPATFALTNTTGPAGSITVVSGTPQSATISTAFAAPLVAVVKDAGGNPVSGVTVTFAAPGTGASGTFAGGVNTATTNSSGIATSAVFTANSTAGSYSVSASASGVSTPATFSLTNNVGPASSIAVVSGTPQSARISTAFAAPLVAVVKDSGGNPVSGVTVWFVATGTGASGTFAGGVNTATTNASGIATSATFTANTTSGGPYNVTASVSGVGTPATFALTNTVGPANSITVVSGTPQSAQISTAFAAPLVAVVKDAGGNPVSGVTVTFTAPGSGASGTFAGGVNTATTNASGIATSATFTANSTVGGPYSVTASVSGVGTPATFALTNTTGPAGSITVVSGTPQSATISTAFAAPLVAVVKDAGGNPVSGVTVTFAAPGTGASGTFAGGVNTATTNASGIATSAVFSANSTAGSYTVSAGASGVGTPATFSLTNNVGPASSIAVVSGTPQSARISTAFAAPLVAVVKDSGGNPVSGVTVTFGAPGTGASGTFAGGVNTATTNASGIATSATFTANTTIGGPYNVTASVSGVGTPATFALTNTVGPASSIAVVSGTPQSAQISTAFAAPLVAVVKDAGGNPVSGVTVTFTAPGSGASGTFAGGVNTATTNASGIATSATFTANSTVGGPYSVTASVSGVGTPATFALTNTTGPAGSITVVSGTPQSGTISTAFAAPLVAVVKDAGGNPVSGVTVTFAAPGTGASGTFAGGVNTATTNSSGIATSAVFTANSTAGSYSVSASASGVSTPATFSLTNNVGPASSIAVVSGTPQSARISTAFAAPLVAVVKDSGGNPVSGVTVTFGAPGTGASGTFAGGVNTATTNSSGIATSAVFTANSTAGSYSVSASASGVSTPATFSLTNNVGPASSIAVVSGTPQSARISTAFAAPLVAVVKDSGGNPVSGVTVTFGAPGTGASGTFAGGVNTATTNASGIATSATFTANTTIGGPYSVTASVSGVGTPATFALTNTVGPASSIAVVSGTPQSAQISTAFAAPLVAVVKDAGGNPVSGVTVTFTAPGSGASGTFAGGVNTATTNSSGIATSAVFTANSTAGSYSVSASASGVSTPATFSLTNNVGPASSIAVVSGTPQSARISTAFAAPLVAVVKDSGGNPVSGVTVTFGAPGTGASGTFAGGVNTATTNSSGIATSAVFTANSTAGSYSVSASASGVSTPATFSLTNNVGPASSIAVVSGTPQSARISTAFAAPLVAVVKDSGGNPVSGVTVTFGAPGTGASGTFAGGVNTATTNASGIATSATFTANTTIGGPYNVTASVSGVGTPATFALTNTVGPANSITVVSGTPQSAQISTAFAAPLVAVVKDAGGNPVSGVTVTFTAPGSGASGTFAGGVNTATTNASGIATSATFTANSTVGGPYSVTASVSGVGTPANFSLTNSPGPAGSITVVSGTPQSATISTAFAAPLVAVVKDAGGNPVSGVTVTFAAPGTGASGTFAGGVNTATTNSSGIATSAVFTANSTAGSYSVSASASGVSTPATFSLTNNVGPASSIAVVSGTPQSARISTAFAAPLVAVVKDSGGNPVSGVTVTFGAPGTGASGTFAGGVNTATTNASGIATSATFTANTTIGGPYNVTASVSGVGTPATFALTNTVGPANSITVVSGTPQSAQISTAFAAPLVAVVKDAGGNPVSGVTVTFTAPGSGASGTFAGGVNTATTNASGIATSATFTANSTVGGPYSVTASVSGVGTPANFSLTNATGTPYIIIATSGSGQSTTISSSFGAPLVATVKDAGGNPVNGVTVTFMAPTSGASATFAGSVITTTGTTNTSGQVSVALSANAIAGPYNVTASVSSVSTPASFALTNNVGVPASVVVVSGTPQSVSISTAFASQLVVVVKDSGGNLLNNIPVTFTGPGTGATATLAGGANTTVVANTNTLGQASVPAKANTVAGGPYTVTATVSGVSTPANFSLTNNTGTPATVTATSGTPQSASISTVFALPLVATVKDSGGNPVSGVTVTFTAPGTGASGTFAGGVNTAVTNSSGTATSAAFTANSTAGGPYMVTASATGATSASFSLTNMAGTPASIVVTSGSPQSVAINTAFAAPLVATVKDSGGNPVGNVVVTFTVPTTGPRGAFAGGVNTATTNSSGVATSATFTANSIAGGPYTVQAGVTGVSLPANFSLTNLTGTPASITATSGTPQSAQISTAFAAKLVATVKDAGGNPVTGITVTFAPPGSGASGTFAGGVNTATTNASGVATSAVFTANSMAGGPYNVSAMVSGVSTPALFNLTNTTGLPNSITVSGGSPQNAKISTAFASALVALVTDSGGNPVSGVTVTFTAPTTGASGTFTGGATTLGATTNASGQASMTITANTTIGGYSVTAGVAGVSTPATFTLTNTPGTPAAIAATSGNPQSATINTAFAQPLTATVTDSGGNPVSGITVTFTAPATGQSGKFANSTVTTTATTNAQGQATASAFTANGTLGAYNVTATVSVLSPTANFVLTNTQPSITTLNPNTGQLGQTLNVLVTGLNTHFVNGTTTAYFGTGITVNSVSVTNSTSATVNVTIQPTTPLAAQTVTLTTGTEAASIVSGFTIQQGSAAIASVNANQGAQSQTLSIAVLGTNTNFTQGVTTASFGPNVGINSVVVTDKTHATVNISISGTATLGAQTVTMTTGGEVASLVNGFTILNGTAQILTVNPSSGHQGDTGDTINLTGQSTHWTQGTTTASFGAGITVTQLTINSATTATAVISIDPAAAIGNRTVTLTTNTEVANSTTSAFQVQAGIPTITLNANFGTQGSNPTITLTGTFTSFASGVTTANFGSNITVGTVTVNGPTQASVPIQIGTGATLGSRTVTITTGTQVVQANFQITTGVPAITVINPNTGVPGASNLSVTVSANFTSWVNHTTVASFGPGISVGGGAVGAAGPVTVSSSGALTATLAIQSGATAGPRNVVVKTGTEQETAVNGFTVQTCTTTAPTVFSTNPVAGATSVPLNATVQVQFTAPINRTALDATDFVLSDPATGQYVPATVSLDASGRIMTLTPSALLAVGHTYYIQFGSLGGTVLQDTCGNSIATPYLYTYPFTTQFGTQTAGPALVANSPVSGDTNDPLNTNVVLQFSTPINPLTQPTGVTVAAGATTIPGTYTFSPDYTQITFVPGSTLSSNTTYTVTLTSALQDQAGNALTDPGSFTFKTGTANVTTNGSVIATNPYANETGVGTNVTPTVYFNTIVDPLTINSSDLILTNQNTGHVVIAAATVAANRLSATLTPAQLLQPNTSYYLQLVYSSNCNYGPCDLAGNYISSSNTYFTTGNGTVTTAPTEAIISPPNNSAGVPVNTQITAIANNQINPQTVNSSSLTVKAGTTVIPGVVNLSNTDYETLTFTLPPTTKLAPSTVYTVTASGFQDVDGNAVATATSTFTTASSNTSVTGSFGYNSVTPVSGTAGVSNTAQIVITFSRNINPATVNNILVQDTSNASLAVSGAWAVNGAIATFTPSSPYPANAVIQVTTQYLVQDLAGNLDNAGVVTTFTVGGTSTTTPLTVTSITPNNGMTGVGRNATISITFSASVNSSTVNGNSVELFNGTTNLGSPAITISADNRTISFTPTTPAGQIIEVVLTSAITDLSGNALVPFQSEYTTAADIPTTGPTVTVMLPGAGATDVPQSAVITLFTSGSPLNAATLSGSFFVSQNGVVLQGATHLTSNNQAIQFTPAALLAYGAHIQVDATAGVQDIYGNPLTAFSGSFTVQPDPASFAPQLIASSPIYGSTGAPLNVQPEYEFDQALASGSVDSTSVQLYDGCSGLTVPGAVNLIGAGHNVVQFVPQTPLTALCSGNPRTYYFQLNYGTSGTVTNTSGVAAPQENQYFTVGTASVTTPPTVTGVSPTNGTTGVGVNAMITITFSGAINPISVNGSTVQVMGASQTAMPVSIGFNGTDTVATFTPQSPLASSTAISIKVTGVTDWAGNVVPTFNSSFTTAAGPDLVAPTVIATSPTNGQTNVPTNTAIVVQFSQPIAAASVNSADFYLYDTVSALNVPGTITVAANGMSATFSPTAALSIDRAYEMWAINPITDLAGNPLRYSANFNQYVLYFTTASSSSSVVPQVTTVNPANGLTAIATNVQPVITFNEPIQPTSLNQITLAAGGINVPVTPSAATGNQVVSLTPNALLLPNKLYTLTVTGVQDNAGHTMTSPFVSQFATGPSSDISTGTITSIDPYSGAIGIATTVTPKIYFSRKVDPISVNTTNFYLTNVITGNQIVATVSVSADQLSATLTPTQALQPDTYYKLWASGLTDVTGNSFSYSQTYFTTGAGPSTTGATVSSISPSNGTTGAPVNTLVTVVMSGLIDPATVGQGAIAVSTSPGNVPVAGTVNLATDYETLTFTPTAGLATSTTYAVTVSGFKDQNENTIVTSNSTFTTGASSTPLPPGSLTAISFTPANGAVLTSNTTKIVITFSSPINPVSANNIQVYDLTNGITTTIAGTWAVTGAVATFTPLSPYPANSSIQVYTQGEVQDFAGNLDSDSPVTFTTANVADTTHPTVTSVTPVNATTGVGEYPTVVLTFSKSLNPSTVNATTVTAFAGATAFSINPSLSVDGRTVTFTFGSYLPGNQVITIAATTGVQDLSGNSLTYFQSQFTTGAVVPPPSSGPTVKNQVPASGATDVPQNSVITLFFSGSALNSSTVAGAIHIAVNGSAITGTTQLADPDSVEFTPSSLLPYGALVQVFVDQTVLDTNGNPLISAYSGQFTVQPNPASAAPTLIASNPGNYAANVPLNIVPQYQFDQALLGSSVSASSVQLWDTCANQAVAGTVSLTGAGNNVVQFKPQAALTALCNGSANQYYFYLNSGTTTTTVTNTSGVPAPAENQYFIVGAASDTTTPTVVAYGPPNGATGVGTNAIIYVRFSKPIDSISITGTTIKVSGGSMTVMPSSISVDPTGTLVTITPQAPLPATTVMTIAVNGVTDPEGHLVTTASSTFTTGAGADVTSAVLVASGPASGDTNVPTNTTAFSMQFNKPLDPLSVTVSSFLLCPDYYCSIPPPSI